MKPIQAILATLSASAITAVADVRITEFLASNNDGLKDDFGDRSDWIEIYNDGPASVDLDGWSLTDDSGNPGKWSFPPVSIPSNGRMIVFASGNDRAIPGLPLTPISHSARTENISLSSKTMDRRSPLSSAPPIRSKPPTFPSAARTAPHWKR